MDGENNGKPYEQMDDLGGPPLFFGNTHIEENLKTSLPVLRVVSYHIFSLCFFVPPLCFNGKAFRKPPLRVRAGKTDRSRPGHVRNFYFGVKSIFN